MNRRGFLCLGVAALVLARPAFAQDVVAGIVRQLERLGYDRITVSRTWLGRAKILGRGSRGTREIIVNPATGEILRDLVRGAGGSGGGDGLLDDTRSGGSGGDDGGGDDGGGDDDGGDEGGGDDGGDDDGDDGGDDDGDDGGDDDGED